MATSSWPTARTCACGGLMRRRKVAGWVIDRSNPASFHKRTSTRGCRQGRPGKWLAIVCVLANVCFGAAGSWRVVPRALARSRLGGRRLVGFGAGPRGCGALAGSTQGCHRQGAKSVLGHRVATAGAASVAAL
jgi:hypothetical protein